MFLCEGLKYLNNTNGLELKDSRLTSSICEKFGLVVLGGTGFSGCNGEFNANNGIYRNTINRDMEIQESKKFEKLYQELIPLLNQKNTVIFTHSPQKDWNSNPNAHGMATAGCFSEHEFICMIWLWR